MSRSSPLRALSYIVGRTRAASWSLPGLLGATLLAVAALLSGLALRGPILEPTPDLVGFFPVEQNAQFAYRFAQPEASLFWNVPLPAGSRLTLRLRSPDPLPPRGLTIGLGGHQVALPAVGAEPRVLRLLLPPGDPTRRGYALDLRAEPARAAGDLRDLGHLYDQIRLDGPAAAVPWATMLAGAGLALLVGLLLATTAGLLPGGVAALSLALLAALDGPRFFAYGLGLALATLATRLWWGGRATSLAARLRGWRLSPAAWATAALVAGYSLLMSAYALTNQRFYGSNAYDLGLYDQTLWQIATFQPLYSSAAGINMVGSHANLMLFPLAALYWIVPDVRLLLVAHVLGCALAPIPLYLLARDRGAPWLGPPVGLAYLIHPATQNATLGDFHIDPMAANALLFALWAADRRRPLVLALCATIVLLSKETFALTTAWLGALLILRRDWRPGLLLLLGSAAWFVFATKLLVPALIGQGESLHLSRFARYGDTLEAVLLTFLTRPGLVLGDLLPPNGPAYLLALLAPLAFLPLFSPLALLAMPGLALNLISTVEQQRTTYYQYSALPLAILAAATLHTLINATTIVRRGGWFKRAPTADQPSSLPRKRLVAAVAGGLSALLLLSAYQGQQGSELRRDAIEERVRRDGGMARYADYILSLIPPGAGVSAHTSFQPHLTHRQQAFLFPNPFVEIAYFNPAGQPFASAVEYIVYDTRRPDGHNMPAGEQLDLLRYLEASGEYGRVAELDGIILLRRLYEQQPARHS